MLHRLMEMQILLYCMAGMGVLGALGMSAVSLTYRKKMKNTNGLTDLKEKWVKLWKGRDLLLHKMNRWVWYPSLACAFFLGTEIWLSGRLNLDGMPSQYVYAGVGVPLGLLLIRQILDFTYKEDLLVDSMVDYVDHAKMQMGNHKIEKMPVRAQVEMVDHIARSIKESAAAKGRFGKLLSPEEEEIMREVIREFMA